MTKWAIHIPYVMGLIGTRSLTQEIAGIDQLVTRARDRVRNGIVAYDLMMQIQDQRASGVDPELIARFREREHDLGYALLLKTRVDDPRQATEAQIEQAAADTVPHVWPIFWAFRIMVGMGFGLVCVMSYFFWRASFRRMSFPAGRCGWR